VKRYVLLLATLLATTGTTAMTPVSEADLVRIRDHELNALIVAHDAAKAQAYYDDQFVLTTSSGKAKTKADLLAEIARPGLVLEVNETSDVAVRVRDRTAVLTGLLHQRGTLDGTAFDVRLRVTDTWVNTGTDWTLLAGHASRL
jgi:hypothetical protein